MKSAVEKLIDNFNVELNLAIDIGNERKIRIMKHLITIATLHLPMEKEAHKQTWEKAHSVGMIESDGTPYMDFEKYYNETFKQQD